MKICISSAVTAGKCIFQIKNCSVIILFHCDKVEKALINDMMQSVKPWIEELIEHYK